MSSFNQLAVLAINQRNQLESLLMEFDQAWTPDLLGDYHDRLESDDNKMYRQLAIAELVKIDLQRSWSSGQGQLLEDYCKRIADLGDADSVDPDLILVEYAARRSVDADLDLQSYASRFPKQFEQVARRASEFLESNLASKPVQASIDTSRVGDIRDTEAARVAQQTTLPQEFGRYRILRELGAGAMGKVYLAHDTQLDRQVALKTPSFSGDKDDELVARFYREARAAAKIQHRNICPIHDVGEMNGQHFISMGFIKGRCMSDYIKPDKLPPQKTSAILIHRLALALAEAHRHNVVHRDLKPANIIIDTKREPVVMDFGLARQTDVESRMTTSGMLVGTPAYMSPEQMSGDPKDVTTAVDVYALGVILYELLTGKLPFRGAIAQVVHQITHKEPTPPSEIRPEIDAELEVICAKMMAKSRAERFQTMDDVAAALKNYLKGNKQLDELEAQPADTAPKEAVEESTETGALNAFFAAQATDDRMQTLVEPRSSKLPAVQTRQPRGQRSGGYFDDMRKLIAAGLVGALILAAGIVYLVRTPYGTIRVEQILEVAGLEVLVDGNSVSLTEPVDVKARKHELALKIGGAELKFDPQTSQFVATQEGNECRLSVTIGDLQLSSKSFTVTKNAETVLKIELIQNAEVVANGNTQDPGDNQQKGVDKLANGFRSLFNGRDNNNLDSFSQRGGKAKFELKDGVLIGTSVPDTNNSFLCTKRTYANFILEYEYLVDSPLNSGVQVRSLSKPGYEQGRVHGYQVEIDATGKYWNASIYDEARSGWLDELEDNQPARSAYKPNEWNKIRVTCDGDSIKTWLNDVPAADLTDDTTASGFIAFQVHGLRKGAIGIGKQVRWRNVRIKELLEQEPDQKSVIFEETAAHAAEYDKGNNYAVVFSPDGEIVDTASPAGTMRIRSVASGEDIKSPTDRQGIEAVAWSADRSQMVLGLMGGKIEVWQVGQPQPKHSFQMPASPNIRRVAISPDNSSVVACGALRSQSGTRGLVESWSLADGSSLGKIDVESNRRRTPTRVFGLDVSPDLSLAAIAVGHGVQVWSLETHELRQTIVTENIADFRAVASTVVFSNDGKLLGLGGYHNLNIVDVATGKILHTLITPRDKIDAVAFSPDGRRVVSCSWFVEKTVKDGISENQKRTRFIEWDLATGENVREWQYPGVTTARHLIFSADGRYLAAAGRSFPLRVWDVRKDASLPVTAEK
jgi:serine/threonine protein kinase/WD40 repeat protein